MSLSSYVPIIGRLVADADDAQTIDIPPVEVHNIEIGPEKRARWHKHLITANHVNHSIVYHSQRYDKYAAHIL
ncbi:hypothetical protein HYQ46_010092 [Verticillium longisporum]|uniref:Uncharacterized protein n=1 Tax=Verticillium longisporum TaxID=100787 RepID=A0A0G4LX23_VERLO|nr:hypothetical protein HYQ44_001083 [Verticillium longisporum]KAG7129803.1 hypothetical protein HYQ46_010092 [Verticillium longisporum]CRK26577.1 hypothetical protein BN1708_014575 [Verticillium longisporum]